ncbi:hypothetical protein POM88_021852 [Heracleum sosnowskyi]|uniref:Disease resistance protein winged helix domain-containing protein n=1 Tax=Heracleum sosnowskyi TaxID=360622 RepID=A0AAD8IGP3_9APIA|nr:hypothetical protein POM88_021852 [Heracleum sosnowskyi]
MDTLEFSYSHLPQHLKPCFLSFGAFPEDNDIPVRKLLWLWIAAGFIYQDSAKKTLEDAAEQYLMDLIRRSLVVVKFGFCGPLTTKNGDLISPDLGHLVHLETLKLLNTIPLCKSGSLSASIVFLRSLKNLTMSNTYLDWKEAWVFEMIPNLEVLKLKFHAFVAFRDHFLVLQRLQVHRCPYLMEIPEDFENICTLEWIELGGCGQAATNSARDIQQEQESYGNDWLKILIIPELTPS